MIKTDTYLFSEIMDGFFDGPHATPEPSYEGPVFLGIKNIKENGGIDLSEIRHISEQEYPNWTKRVIPKQGDIVFSYEATLHRYALIPPSFRGCLGRRMALIRVKKEIVDSLFLYYHFLSPYWKAFVETIKISGSTVDRISISDFPKYEINLPPLPSQQKIASILSAYDDLIENNNQRIKLLEEMAEEIYKEWFVRLRFPGYQECKYFDKDGTQVERESEGALPEGWEEILIEKAFDISGGGTPSTAEESYWTDGSINWFSPTDITASNNIFLKFSSRKITEKGLSKSAAKMFPPKCIMMTSRATIGAIGINETEACTNQGFITCIPNNRFTYTYIYHWIKSNKPTIESHSSGATFKEISRGVFKNLRILQPTEQNSKQFFKLTEPFFNEIQILGNKNQLLQETRDLLLPRLISGKLSVEGLITQRL